MASKKVSADTKSKSTVAQLEVAPVTNQKNGNQMDAPIVEAGFGKAGKTKKSQASKKVAQSPVQELEQKPSQEPVETPVEMPLETPAKAGKVKATKAPTDIVDPAPVQIAIVEPVAVAKKGSLEITSEKPPKMKRLTLDIAKPLHKAIKARAVEEGVPMVDMLRLLLEEHYGK